jgi:two-component system chemotaxis response regulator CheB
MSGIELLKSLETKPFIPTVMITALSSEDGSAVLDALSLGAVDYIQKPEFNQITSLSPLIRESLKSAAMVKTRPRLRIKGRKVIQTPSQNTSFHEGTLILIGASTGGTEAIRIILESLPEKIPPILVVQHIPPLFSKAFSDRMNDLCSFPVQEAKNNQPLIPNQVLIAPGGYQMGLIRSGSSFSVSVNQDAPVNRFKPSVDYLFDSVLNAEFKGNIVASLLTGMGSDGAKGLKRLKDFGARTIAQDEATSVVFGMPKEAIALNAAEFVLPVDDIGKKIYELSQKEKRKTA